MGIKLGQAGVETHVMMPVHIHDSGLSRMLYGGTQVHGYDGLKHLWGELRRLTNKPPAGRRLIWVYYGQLDKLSHTAGPDSERAKAEIQEFCETMASLFVEQLSPRADLLLLLTSDHGQIATPRDASRELRNHPLVMQKLHMKPTGESRLMYLCPRPGQLRAVLAYFESVWHEDFRLLPSRTAVKAGLFGPGKPDPATFERIGDLIALAQGEAYLWWGPGDNPLLGRHGGLSSLEMLVPLLAARLK